MIFLLHIPKTGGQTLATRLAAAYPPGRAYIMRDNIEDGQTLIDRCRSYDFVEAHVGHASLSTKPDDIDVISVVRDPVEQILSHYRHIRRGPDMALHRIANAMAPTDFLLRFASFFCDFQARALVRAHVLAKPEALWRGEQRWLMRHIYALSDRIRWIAPTERMDEFCLLWTIETGLPVPQTGASVNVAPQDGIELDRLRQWLRDRAELFAADLALWNHAKARYRDYARGLIAERTAAGATANNATCAWLDEGSGIWLTEGWHPRSERDDGVAEWWSGAGPTAFSEIRVVRRRDERTLGFEIPALTGVHPSAIRFFAATPNGLSRIAHTAETADEQTGLLRVAVPLRGLEADARLVLFAPENNVYLKGMHHAVGRERRTVATQNWRLD
jgi:hypothetical protein